MKTTSESTKRTKRLNNYVLSYKTHTENDPMLSLYAYAQKRIYKENTPEVTKSLSAAIDIKGIDVNMIKMFTLGMQFSVINSRGQNFLDNNHFVIMMSDLLEDLKIDSPVLKALADNAKLISAIKQKSNPSQMKAPSVESPQID